MPTALHPKIGGMKASYQHSANVGDERNVMNSTHSKVTDSVHSSTWYGRIRALINQLSKRATWRYDTATTLATERRQFEAWSFSIVFTEQSMLASQWFNKLHWVCTGEAAKVKKNAN